MPEMKTRSPCCSATGDGALLNTDTSSSPSSTMKDAAGVVSVADDRIVWTVPVRAKKLCVPGVVLSQMPIMDLISVFVTAPGRSASAIDENAHKSVQVVFFMVELYHNAFMCSYPPTGGISRLNMLSSCVGIFMV